jgi:hypothetical protein
MSIKRRLTRLQSFRPERPPLFIVQNEVDGVATPSDAEVQRRAARAEAEGFAVRVWRVVEVRGSAQPHRHG